MKRNHSELVRVSDAAAHWLLRLEQDDSPQTRAEFDKWLRQGGPAYYEEFLLAQMKWNVLDRLDASFDLGSPTSPSTVVELPARDHHLVATTAPSPADEEQQGSDLAATHETLPGSVSRDSGHLRQWGWVVGLAASLVLAVGLFVSPWPFGSQVYATAVGGQQSIKLEDGSLVQLNTHSRVEVRFSEQLREVRLLEGEAMFTVAHNAARPFIVVTDSARVRAVGTQFNVYQTETDATRVAVLEGVVQVTTGSTDGKGPTSRIGADEPRSAASLPSPSQNAKALQNLPDAEAGRQSPAAARPRSRADGDEGNKSVVRLAAGDEAVVAGGRVEKAAVPDVQRAVAWQNRRLVFEGDRIAYIAEQFNRYNDLKIRVEGSVAEHRMGGTFDVDDPMPMVRYLSRDPRVEVIRTDKEILIRPRKASGSVE